MATIRSRIVTNLTELLVGAVAEGWVVTERGWRDALSTFGKCAFVYHEGETLVLESGGPEALNFATLRLRIAVIASLDQIVEGSTPGETLDELVAQLQVLLPLDEPDAMLGLPIVEFRLQGWNADRASDEGLLTAVLELACSYRHDVANPSTVGGATP